MENIVRLEPSGIEFRVPDGESILDAALAERINLPYSCSNGLCGECRAVLEEGSIKYDRRTSEMGLEDNEILTCCSFPESNIVLATSYIKELSAIDQKVVPVKVDSLRFLNSEVLNISLRLPPTTAFDYLPGQFIELMWKDQKRSYSLASHSAISNRLELHVKNVNGGVFSQLLFHEVSENQLFRLYGPAGTFFVRESDSPVIFICTGSGFAPVKAMVESLLDKGLKRKVYIYWGGQYRKDLYSSLPTQWAENNQTLEYTAVLSRELVLGGGEVSGYCQHAVIDQHEFLEGFDVYACGSTLMIKDAKNIFIEHGLDAERFYSDAFFPSN